ncbi:hypothetical protein, partial [Mesorhizobium sp.]|uniref:hypothetical protein n=1 Tax=Mesorhizobium sp. TaxID=1871066 RepID=UPI0025DB5CEF
NGRICGDVKQIVSYCIAGLAECCARCLFELWEQRDLSAMLRQKMRRERRRIVKTRRAWLPVGRNCCLWWSTVST